MAGSDLALREEHSLALIESADTDGDGIFNADGTVNVVVIRPCEGRGPGGRIYTRELLESTAGMWSDWPSYMNHEDPAARKASAKLRRGPDELAGELRETTWDSAYTTPDDGKYGYEQGAVVGKFMPASDLVEGLLRRVPKQLKLSIKAQATGLRRQQRKDGSPGYLVEGIENDPEKSSVDLVTAAGAGGRVRSLIESIYDDSHDSSATDGLADLTGEQLTEWLAENRPDVLDQEPGVSDMTLQEALQSDEVKNYLGAMIADGVKIAIVEERKTLEESIRAELGFTTRMRGLHAEALRLIEAAPLPKAAKAKLREEYKLEDLDEEKVQPGPALALVEAVEDQDGTVTKTAKQVLAEAIDRDVKSIRNMLRESAPTTVYAPGPGDNGQSAPASFGGENSAWAQRLRARGVNPELFGATKAQTA